MVLRTWSLCFTETFTHHLQTCSNSSPGHKKYLSNLDVFYVPCLHMLPGTGHSGLFLFQTLWAPFSHPSPEALLHTWPTCHISTSETLPSKCHFQCESSPGFQAWMIHSCCFLMIKITVTQVLGRALWGLESKMGSPYPNFQTYSST